jgi:hypothetical protein
LRVVVGLGLIGVMVEVVVVVVVVVVAVRRRGFLWGFSALDCGEATAVVHWGVVGQTLLVFRPGILSVSDA